MVKAMVGEVEEVGGTLAGDGSAREARGAGERASVWGGCSMKCPMAESDSGAERDIAL